LTARDESSGSQSSCVSQRDTSRVVIEAAVRPPKADMMRAFPARPRLRRASPGWRSIAE